MGRRMGNGKEGKIIVTLAVHFSKQIVFRSKCHDFRTSILMCCLNNSEKGIDSD